MAWVNYEEIRGQLACEKEKNQMKNGVHTITVMTGEHKNDCKTPENNASTLNVSIVWASVCGFLSVFEVKKKLLH